MPEIARTLDEATPALDFELPLEAGDDRYVNFDSARGAGTVRRLRKLLERQPSGKWLRVVFASHRGAGKSTELKRIAHQVQARYFSIYFEANCELDSVKFEMEDLMLVIARVVEAEMRQRNTPLPAHVLNDMELWFSQVVFTSEVEKKYESDVKAELRAEGGVPFFAKLMAAITSTFRVDSTYRESVKSTLKRYPGALTTLVNALLDAASERLVAEGKNLLLIIDNMDRYDPKVVDELLVQSADRFQALWCHVIVTPPIGLVLKPESQGIDQVFTTETMPTVKVREPSQGYGEFSGPGRESLLRALGLRIDLDALIPDVTARDRLVAASGGGIRELLELAQDASLDAEGDVISLDAVESALNRRRQTLRSKADANGWWPALQTIARTKRLDETPESLEVVFQRLAFQYNGKVWYDVHPLLSDFPEIQEVLAKPKAEARPGAKPREASSKKAK